MSRTIAFASLGILGMFIAGPGAARAQAPVELATLSTPARGNVVGGGGASLSGGGFDESVTYSSTGAGAGARFEQTGRASTFGGNDGDKPYWIYRDTVAMNPGREGWMIGGGDDAQVSYSNPAGRR